MAAFFAKAMQKPLTFLQNPRKKPLTFLQKIRYNLQNSFK